MVLDLLELNCDHVQVLDGGGDGSGCNCGGMNKVRSCSTEYLISC